MLQSSQYQQLQHGGADDGPHHVRTNNSYGMRMDDQDTSSSRATTDAAALFPLPRIVRHSQLLETAARLHMHLSAQHRQVMQRLKAEVDDLMARQESEVSTILQLGDRKRRPSSSSSVHQLDEHFSGGGAGMLSSSAQHHPHNDGSLIISGHSIQHLIEKHSHELSACMKRVHEEAHSSEREARRNFASFLRVAAEDLEEMLVGSRRQSLSLFAPSNDDGAYTTTTSYLSSPFRFAPSFEYQQQQHKSGSDNHDHDDDDADDCLVDAISLHDTFFLPTTAAKGSLTADAAAGNNHDTTNDDDVDLSEQQQEMMMIISIKFPNVLRVQYSTARTRDPSLAPIVCDVSDVQNGFLRNARSLNIPSLSTTYGSDEKNRSSNATGNSIISSSSAPIAVSQVNVVKAHLTRQAVGRQGMAVIMARTHEELAQFCSSQLGVKCHHDVTMTMTMTMASKKGMKEVQDDDTYSVLSSLEEVPVDLVLDDYLREQCVQVLHLPKGCGSSAATRTATTPQQHPSNGSHHQHHHQDDVDYVRANVYPSGGLFGVSLIVPLALEDFKLTTDDDTPTSTNGGRGDVFPHALPVAALQTLMEAAVGYNADIINMVILRSCEQGCYSAPTGGDPTSLGHGDHTTGTGGNSYNDDDPPYYHFFKNLVAAVAALQMQNNGNAMVLHGTGLSRGLFSVPETRTSLTSSSPKGSSSSSSYSAQRGTTTRGNWSWNLRDTRLNVFLDVASNSEGKKRKKGISSLESVARRAVDAFDGVEICTQ